MATSIVSPLRLSSDAARELGMSRVGLLGAIVLPLLACMLVGQGIYRALVRWGPRDARLVE